ncbi:UNVERIFIED_CONTAM: hypothetical protein PYX00_005412 [Menopon gallinae]|uniref:RRM domain-containing protein n=1 Tax=Menopon gallinae TaxID=328185 RepID=A0AAW2HSL1_9NEOP
MGDLELSLDDIIKKKLGKSNVNRNRSNGLVNKKPTRRLSDPATRAAKGTANANNKSFPKVRGGVNKNARGAASQVNVGDARFKIIQKQRQKITDAREKLGQIAKQTDARLRLMKLRERRVQAQARIYSKAVPEDHVLQRTIRPNVAFEDELMDFSNDIAYMTRNYPERLISDEEAYNYQYRNRQDMPVIYRTFENDVPPSMLYSKDQSIYSWKNPKASPVVIHDIPDIPVKRIAGRVLQSANFRSDDRQGESPAWEYDESPIVITKKVKPVETVGILKRPGIGSFHDREAARIIKESPPPGMKSRGPAKTLNERFCQDGNPSAQKISLLKARLEESGSKLSEKEGDSVGHRIVVSNLVPSVTHEDVKELFEDIGELISSKVVRPGTAEVVYKLHKDAVKAVDVYHNRQLDGQPMKCLLVNNRSSLPSKASKLSDRKLGKGVVELDMTAFRKALHKKSTS